MKKTLTTMIAIAIAILFTACGNSPKADFTWSPVEPVAGDVVTFTNLSENANSYSWNFGDMSIGSEENPTHVYERSGQYIVDLRAHKFLSSHEKTVTIIVK